MAAMSEPPPINQSAIGSFIAQVVQVSVDADGTVKPIHVWCVVDCGLQVNPDTIRAQMQSGIVFGLSGALYGQITLDHGAVQQSNFHNYPMMRINEMPVVETYILDSGEAPGGLGEPGVPPVAPALCNALFALTGKRIRTLPIRTEELRKA